MEQPLGPGFKEQGNDDGAAGAAGFAPGVRFRIPGRPDARMEDGFQAGAGGGKCEDLPGQFLAVQMSVWKQNSGAEAFANFGQGGLPRLNGLAGKVVGVNDRHAVLQEETAGGGFAHADAAGDAKNDHWGKWSARKKRTGALVMLLVKLNWPAEFATLVAMPAQEMRLVETWRM